MREHIAPPPHPSAEAFIKFWTDRTGGAERADAQTFLNELCGLPGVDTPHDAQRRGTPTDDYRFERPVRFRHDDGSDSSGWIDLYKKNCFVLEAKQSKKRREGGDLYQQLPLALQGGGTSVLELPRPKARGTAKSGMSPWDALMRSARRQAEDYARALDEWPPFLVVVDVGHVIELYADFSLQGKNYAQFPDRNAFRIALTDLARDEIRALLRRNME